MTAIQLVAPFLGAVLLEVIHWYQLRTRLHLARYRKALYSPTYWVVTIAMIMFGGLGALILFGDIPAAQLLLAGAAFPTIFKKFVALFVKQHVKLGDDEETSTRAVATPSINEYFSVA